MAERDIETRTKAMEEYVSASNTAEKSAVSAASKIVDCFEKLKGASAKVEAGIKKVEESYKNFGNAANDLAASLGKVENAVSELKSNTAGDDSKDKDSGGYGPFWFLKPGGKDDKNTDYGKALEDYKNSVAGLGEVAEKEYTALAGYNELHEKSILSRQTVMTKAYDAMAEQMLKQIEGGESSINDFARVVAQQVKIELVGLAARAAVWMLFESAMGFATLFSNPAAAAAHFKSAAEFAAISTVSYVAAKQVHNVQEKYFASEEKKSNTDAGATKGARLSGATAAPVSLSSEAQPRQTQHITIQIYNPLSEQNWEKIAEQNIIPAINSAVNRNVVLTVK